MVKEFQTKNDVKQIRKMIAILTDEFAVSHNPHSRKGGLIGLAATAIALGKVNGSLFYILHFIEHHVFFYIKLLFPGNKKRERESTLS